MNPPSIPGVLLGGAGTEAPYGDKAKKDGETDKGQHLRNGRAEISAEDHQFVEAGSCPAVRSYLGDELHPFGGNEEGPPATAEGRQYRDTTTATEEALRSVLTRVASIMAKAEDIITIRMERMMAAAGDSPRSRLKAKIPTAQKINI